MSVVANQQPYRPSLAHLLVSLMGLTALEAPFLHSAPMPNAAAMPKFPGHEAKTMCLSGNRPPIQAP
ncbi:hypothetical protein CEP54_004141 [Fusarium duplospermum]|uniref:Uncharacterized protein n=1 Tax=Fusarium duplospermum TaxID=1325734 RepID=A0A428QK37_9HYPO|nr:hypothetical protein CEP54_004141 [Fusarium duplospermum]